MFTMMQHFLHKIGEELLAHGWEVRKRTTLKKLENLGLDLAQFTILQVQTTSSGVF